jgi:SAM-dependent methyltransferase
MPFFNDALQPMTAQNPARHTPAFGPGIDPLTQWNKRYGGEHYHFGEAPNHYLSLQGTHLRPGTALALCDGEGRNGVWLAQQGLRVEAFDLSPVGIEKAHRLAASRNVTLECHCCTWQDFRWQDAAYDNVVGIFFQFADPLERAQLFAHIDRSLKPGGTLVIQGYGIEQLRFNTGGPGKLEHLYDEALLREAFPAYEILDLRTYEQEVLEGPGHSGSSALVGLVARKPGGTKA